MINYPEPGRNRVWYRSANFQAGVEATLQLYDPDLVVRPMQVFKVFNDGHYYLDFNFDKSGSWLGEVYEFGERVVSITFHVGNAAPGIITHTN